ncbi:MAG TPA: amino acid adenylation domain-containing protein, partial [Thermoanaerobaculia bacterium]|nr:amino acid adenylation domain-containing protein [Thermoanaerobaculia bacterium]
QRFLLQTLGRLWLSGVEIDWAGFHGAERRRRVPLPAYPFERQRYWVGGIEPKPAALPGLPAATGAAPVALVLPEGAAADPAWTAALEARGYRVLALPAGPPTPEALDQLLGIQPRLAETSAVEESPASGHARTGIDTPYVEPRTEVERLLAVIWGDLLGIDRVGAHDSFFELGGHSLLGLQLVARLQAGFGVEIPLRTLFEAPTLAALAAAVAAELEQRRTAGATAGVPPLVPVPREGALPLSFSQRRLWFIDQLDPGTTLYNLPVVLRAEGPLQPAVLRRCLEEIVRRHEAVRTVFAVQEDAPVQVILPPGPFALPLVDLAGLPEPAREAAALALAVEESGRPFDLARDPMLRGVLLRLAREDHAVALTTHHVASDGWSIGILVREVTAIYAAFAQGEPSPLPELAVQYADFAVWQHSWLHGENLEQEIDWWRRQLAGLPPLLELPTDRPRPAVQSYRGTSRPVALPAGLIRPADELGRSEGATLFMVLLAAFQALLARYSGQDDLAVGTPVAGRKRLETEGLIGFFVNTLVLRGDLTGNPTFRELLGRVRETALAAYLHQDVPFEKLVEELVSERSLAHTPLFQVMLVLQNAPAESLEIQDLLLRSMEMGSTTAKFDLTLDLLEEDGGLLGAVEHATDLFDVPTIGRLLGHFERLLASAAAEPDRRIFDLPIASEAESVQILYEWNDTRVDGITEGCLHQEVAAQAARTPSAVAVEMGSERWTYRRLIGSARLLARHLQELGVGPDAIVGLCAERSPAMMVGMLAVLEAGGAWLPLDPAYPAERLAFMLDDSEAPVLLVQESLLDRVPAAGRRVVPLDARWDAGEDMGQPLKTAVTPGNLAYVIYTSGSTGQPKGVMVPHRGICNRLRWANQVYGLDERDACLQKTSPSFDVSVWECFAPLFAGARLVLASPDRQGEASYLVGAVREHGVTLINVVPSLLEVFCAEEDVEKCVSLRQILVGGEALTPELRDRMLARLPVPLDNLYGPTEVTIDTSRWVCAPGQEPHRVPIGRPIGNSRLYVVDPEMRPMPLGVAGELLVGGAGVTRGYLRRPGLTAGRFIPDPFGDQPGERLYRTGDLVRWLPDGSLDFLGRLDHQVKVRGFRIELGEIETALAALPGVQQAVVVVREERPEGGARDPRLVAYVVGDIAAEELRRALRERLPDYMVPAAFVRLPALPLMTNGKVDRKALPAPERQASQESYVAPRTPVEEVLAGIWSELLGLDQVGADDAFFDLGGHSLLATQVMSRLRRAFGVELPVRDLFEAPTVAGLAARVEAARRTG